MANLKRELGIGGGAFLIGSAFNALRPDERDKLLKEVVAERRANVERLKRTIRGNLTPQERALEEAGNAANLEEIQGTLARRGVSRGPAAASIIARARQEPILRRQAQAEALLPGALTDLEQSIQLLRGNEGFNTTLGSISKNLSLLNRLSAMKGESGDADGGGGGLDLSVLGDAINILSKAFSFLKPGDSDDEFEADPIGVDFIAPSTEEAFV